MIFPRDWNLSVNTGIATYKNSTSWVLPDFVDESKERKISVKTNIRLVRVKFSDS